MEHVQVIVTEIKQMTLCLYLSYLIAKGVIPFTLMLYTWIFSNCQGADPEFSQNIWNIVIIIFIRIFENIY